MYMQNTCSVHGMFFPTYQGERCPGCVQREVETLLKHFEERLRSGDYTNVDRRLESCEVEKAAPATLLAALSITAHEPHMFQHRAAFLARVEARLIETLGPERATKLLEHRR